MKRELLKVNKTDEDQLDERERLYVEIQDVMRASAASHGHVMEDIQTPKLMKQSSSISNLSKMPAISAETFYERI